MTVSTLAFFSTLVATEGQTVFAYAFKILAAADLKVYQNGAELTFGVDYTVAGAGSVAGGTFTLTSGATAGDTLFFRRETARTQATALAAGERFYEAAIEAALDKAMMVAQEFPGLAIPTYPPGYYLRTKADGSGIEAVQSVALGTAMPFDTGTGPPTEGTWATGHFRLNSTPSSGSPFGWRCAIGGTPGTWYAVDEKNTISIKDLGADPNGALDSFAAISNSLALGVPVFFPSGTYRTSAGITPPVGAVMFGVPHLSWIKPDAGVAVTLQLESSNFIHGISLDGVNTNGKKGLYVGAALNDYTKVSEMDIKRYLGAGAYGFHLGDAVSFTGDRIYANQNDINLLVEGGAGSGPTNSLFTRSAFREATQQGVLIKTAYCVGFRYSLFESNTLEGVKIVPGAGGTVIGADIDHCWFEGNYDASNYAFFADGSAGGGATCRFSLKDNYFNGATSKAIRILDAHNFVLENNQMPNTAGYVSIEGTSYGFIDKHPLNLAANVITRGANTTIVDIGDAEAWTPWVPTITPGGSMTLSAETINFARYKLISKTCFVEFSYAATVGGTPNAGISISLPTGVVPAAGSDMFRPITVTDNAAFAIALLGAGGAGGLNLYNGVGGVTPFTAGAIAIWFSVSFEID